MTGVFLLSGPNIGVRSLSKKSTSHTPHALASDMSMISPRVSTGFQAEGHYLGSQDRFNGANTRPDAP
jgi:hypothetical protein